jgi:O-antigen ligase
LAVSEIGYAKNGTGFQGILNHPQAFGTTMAVIGALVMGKLLSQKRPSWKFLAITLVCIVLIVLSEARTAGMALILALGVSVVFIMTFSGQSIRSAMPVLRSKRFIVLVLLFLVFLIVPGLPLHGVVNDYISKSTDVDSLWSAYQVSRAVLFDPMIANISESPIFGIGFGIASDSTAMNVRRDPLFGIPISAPVEKGVMPLAILEEVGVVGFILVAIWILFLLRRSTANGIASFLVSTTVLLINLGESTLFSPGGMGMFMLILLNFAVTKPKSTKFSQININSYKVAVNA